MAAEWGKLWQNFRKDFGQKFPASMPTEEEWDAIVEENEQPFRGV